MPKESEMMSFGYTPEWSEGSVKPPIFQTSTFVFKTAEEGKRFFEVAYGKSELNAKEEIGLIYSRINNPKYRFAGKTGTAQVKRITEEQRELDLETSQIPYDDRDHALYVAFGPYKNPRYALSIIIEHGGSGSSTAAPMAKKLFKLIIDRHELRENEKVNEFLIY